MTQPDRPGPETWLAARLAAGKPAETWAGVPDWYYEQIGLPVPAAPHQVSDQGRIRNANGRDLSDRPNGRPRELPPEEHYRLINLSTGGKKVTVPVHHVVLAAHCPEDRDGRDTRHLGRGRECRAWNWYPEGVVWGTKPENAADKAPEVRAAAARTARAAQTAAGTAKPPRPTFRCLYWSRCGGMVLNEGSRCGACIVQIGKDATVLLGCVCHRRPSASFSATRQATGSTSSLLTTGATRTARPMPGRSALRHGSGSGSCRSNAGSSAG